MHRERAVSTNLGGIVLAGGAGRRLGRPKPTALLDGLTLVERAVDILRPQCRTLIVVSRPEVALPPLDASVCFDRPGPDAPLNALATGLAALEADDVLVLACDLPAVRPVVERLAELPAGAIAMARERQSGRWQPLCARYARLAALEACDRLLGGGEVRLLPLVEALRPTAIMAGAAELANVNTPEDLARLAALRRRGPPVGC
jgi:molybdopterin-guanine dinucleotide biosynthesis protein A